MMLGKQEIDVAERLSRRLGRRSVRGERFGVALREGELASRLSLKMTAVLTHDLCEVTKAILTRVRRGDGVHRDDVEKGFLPELVDVADKSKTVVHTGCDLVENRDQPRRHFLRSFVSADVERQFGRFNVSAHNQPP